jgi:hypothetical protein
VEYVTKDTGERMEFETGSRRDTNKGKPRPGLIGPELKRRLGELMARGAEKYGDGNWRLGQKASRYHDSLERHLLQWQEGDDSEDHLAAIAFNVMGIMHLEKHMPEHLDHERYDLSKRPEPVKDREPDPVIEKAVINVLELTNIQKVNAGLRGFCARCLHWHDVDADWCEGLRITAPTVSSRYQEPESDLWIEEFGVHLVLTPEQVDQLKRAQATTETVGTRVQFNNLPF